MIVVTVGTTMPFPTLIEEVDRLAGLGVFHEEVVCQTGHTQYTPSNCKSFPFRNTLDDLYRDASLVITHGGSTVFTLLSLKKRFIAFPNPIGADQHQLHVLRTLEEQVNLFWSENTKDLERLYKKAITSEPVSYNTERLGDAIKVLVAKNRRG
jgi:UDP-N-acetylglucosamine transferase subunit ALG13